MKGLKDKRVLITGGGSGIGAATAERFLKEGSLVVVLDKNEEACSEIKKRLPSLRETIKADVSVEKDISEAFIELDRIFNGLDVLINNAGISFRKPFIELEPEQWCKVIDVNLNGMFYVSRQAARRMLQGAGVLF